MKTFTKSTAAVLIGLICLIPAGCEKSATDSSNTWDINSAEKSAVTAQQTFDGLNALTDAAFNSSNLKSGTLGDCPVITMNISQLPYILTLDWGTGFTGTDGITRSGMITISLSGKMGTVGSEATFTFTDFYSNGNKIAGTHTITYTGLSSGDNWPRFEVHTAAQITFPDNKSMTYNSDNVRLFAAGSDTPLNWADDVWRIEGNCSGTTRSGINWIGTVTSALVKKVACKWFDSGTLVITPDGGLACTIDFGDGTCNNKATLTIEDKTINVEM